NIPPFVPVYTLLCLLLRDVSITHPSFLFSLSFYSYRHHRDLHSFPTRRSSDLKVLKEEPLPPSTLNVQMPSAMDAVVRKALAKRDRKSTRLNSSHRTISYAVFCLKKKKKKKKKAIKKKIKRIQNVERQNAK